MDETTQTQFPNQQGSNKRFERVFQDMQKKKLLKYESGDLSNSSNNLRSFSNVNFSTVINSPSNLSKDLQKIAKKKLQKHNS